MGKTVMEEQVSFFLGLYLSISLNGQEGNGACRYRYLLVWDEGIDWSGSGNA